MTVPTGYSDRQGAMGADERALARGTGTASAPPASRRVFLKRAALGVGGLLALDLVAACSPAAPPASPTAAPPPPAATTAPAAAKPTAAPATTAAAPAATQAPAAAPTAAAAPTGQLVAAMDVEPPMLDPNVVTVADFRQVNSYLFDTLTQVDLTSEADVPPIKPGLATSWSVAPDGVTWTFKLRQGVKFSDGTDFNADAAKLLFDRIADPNSKVYSQQANGQNARYGFGLVKSTRVVDPSTLEVVLSQLSPDLPRLLAIPGGGVVAPSALTKYSADELGTHPVGTGPFTLTRWDRGQQIVLAANPNYWGGPPKVATLIIRPVADANTRVSSLLTGEIQFVHLVPPGGLSQRLRQESKVKLYITGGPNVVLWPLNAREGPTADKRVRQALNYAIDRDALVKQQDGLAIPARGIYAPGNPAYTANLKGYTYDPAQAKQLLAAAGYPNGFSFEMNVPNGTAGWEPTEIWQLIQANLRAVGVQVNLTPMDGTAYSSFITPGLTNGAVAGVTHQQTGADLISVTETLLATSSQAPKGGNRGWYSNPQVDQLFDQVHKEADLDKRIALYQQVDSVALDDAAYLYLYYKKIARAALSSVKGIYAPASIYYTLNSASVS